MTGTAAEPDYDVLVVGSGFGGSVTALRLTEKGYRVCVVEAGRRFDESTYPRTSWQLRRFLWAPKLGCTGLQRIHPLKDVIVLAGAGVGGGSLVYANTLYEPLAPYYTDPQWRHITDWRSELAPYYDQAKRMLGVVTYDGMTASDTVMLEVAKDMGVGESFHNTPVGVYFGESGVDPYFGGAGPIRQTCIQCGACMTGCRHTAKVVAPAGAPDAYQLRGDPRREVAQVRRGLLQGHRDHQLVPPRRAHPHRTGPVRQGLQLDGHAADAAHRRRHPPYPRRQLAQGVRQPAAQVGPDAVRTEVVGEDDHRAGHAVAGQLDHRLQQTHLVRPPQTHQPAGPRRAEPYLDPRRQRGGTPRRRQDRRLPRRHLDRDRQHPDDRAHPGWRRDRRLPRHRGDRPVPPGVRPPRAARGGRRRGLGQPGSEPVADDHRAGGSSR